MEPAPARISYMVNVISTMLAAPSSYMSQSGGVPRLTERAILFAGRRGDPGLPGHLQRRVDDEAPQPRCAAGASCNPNISESWGWENRSVPKALPSFQAYTTPSLYLFHKRTKWVLRVAAQVRRCSPRIPQRHALVQQLVLSRVMSRGREQGKADEHERCSIWGFWDTMFCTGSVQCWFPTGSEPCV